MNKAMLVAILMSAILAGGCSCRGCGSSEEASLDRDQTLPSASEPLTDVTAQAVPDSARQAMVYRDSDGAFSLAIPLAIPKDWYRIEAGAGSAAEALQPKARRAARAVFQAVAADAAPQPFFSLFVFDKGDFDSLASQSGAAPGAVISEDAGRVVAALAVSANPYPSGGPDHDRFNTILNATPMMIEEMRRAAAPTSDAPVAPTAAGVYGGVLAAADAAERKITLVLKKSGVAELTTVYADKGEPVVEKGRWTKAGDVVALTLAAPKGQQDPEQHVWTLKEGKLIPKSWDKNLYGEIGLPLERQETE